MHVSEAGGQAVSAHTVFAPAKINLFLHVTGRRGDGYHLLDSLIAFAGIGDRITVEPSDELTLRVTGPFSGSLPASGDNLVMRAARALAEKGQLASSIGATIVLEKNLPVSSGIGGGSADAAATLKALRSLWSVPVDDAALAAMGLVLGADIPVCLQSRTSRMQGIGEKIEPARPLPQVSVVLVNPGVAVSTVGVFARRSGGFSDRAEDAGPWDDAAAMADGLRRSRNDLTDAAVSLEPVIGDVLAALDAVQGCLVARLSGSGATCFGLFANEGAASRAADSVSAAHPGWWVRATGFVNS